MVYDLYIKTLYEGCYLASISCAVMSAKFPELSFEHSWDGINYSVQDGFGSRGTITFQNTFCVGAFRSDNSERLNIPVPYSKFFVNCPTELLQLAERETLQYLLENSNGEVLPLITACFWGDYINLESNDSWETVFSNGGSIVIPQLSAFEIGLEHWRNYYEMSDSELNLVKKLFRMKMSNPNIHIFLDNDDVELLSQYGLEGFEEAGELLKAMDIYIK